MLVWGARRGEERGVAARTVAGQSRGFFGNSGWALALAGRRCRHRIGTGPSLLPAAAVASGLVTAALLAVGGGPVALRGVPAAPAACGVPAGGAAVPCLGPPGQEPALTAFEQAPATARVPTTRTGHQGGRLTRGRGGWRLHLAHGRDCSRAVGRRGGDAPRRRLVAPTRTELSSAVERHAQGNVLGPGRKGHVETGEKRAKTAISESRRGSTGSARMAHFLAARNMVAPDNLGDGHRERLLNRHRRTCPGDGEGQCRTPGGLTWPPTPAPSRRRREGARPDRPSMAKRPPGSRPPRSRATGDIKH